MVEAAVSAESSNMAKAQANGLGMTLILTGTDPEQTKPGAGVGLITRDPAHVRQLAMNTSEGAKAQSLGRLIKGAIKAQTGHEYLAMVCYGWQGSDQDPHKASRTDALIMAARLEEKLRAGAPSSSRAI